jgi:hypothetical protein
LILRIRTLKKNASLSSVFFRHTHLFTLILTTIKYWFFISHNWACFKHRWWRCLDRQPIYGKRKPIKFRWFFGNGWTNTILQANREMEAGKCQRLLRVKCEGNKNSKICNQILENWNGKIKKLWIKITYRTSLSCLKSSTSNFVWFFFFQCLVLYFLVYTFSCSTRDFGMKGIQKICSKNSNYQQFEYTHTNRQTSKPLKILAHYSFVAFLFLTNNFHFSIARPFKAKVIENLFASPLYLDTSHLFRSSRETPLNFVYK